MFWHGQERKVRELEEKIRTLELDLKALARDHLDLDACVAKWMKRDRERARREGAVDGAAQTTAGHASSANPNAGMLPPPGLQGARLRIWKRRHRQAGGDLERVPVNELGNEEENGDG